MSISQQSSGKLDAHHLHGHLLFALLIPDLHASAGYISIQAALTSLHPNRQRGRDGSRCQMKLAAGTLLLPPCEINGRLPLVENEP